jgi:ABC-2 type transport system ATP-binding protein
LRNVPAPAHLCGKHTSPTAKRLPLISARDLTKSYPGVQALDGLTVDIEPGIIGFVGANGAGKSTFLRILLGLLPPTSGSATVLGFDVQTEPFELRKLLGYMPEHDCLPLDVSGTDFVTHMAQISGLPFTAARERAAEMLRHVGLHEERYRLIGSYSTGMKQRIKLAQALAHDPRLLLLDEPTNGLDPEGREEMLALVERTGREFGIAVVVTSHLLGEIERVCESLLAIDAGKLQYAGPVATFMQRSKRLLVEIDDDLPEFTAQLRARGLEVAGNGRAVTVGLVDDGVYDVVRDVAASMSAPLSRLEVTRHKLEELFRQPALEVQND